MRARLIALAVAALLAACDTGPTCEERGGELKLLYVQPVISGNVIVMIPHFRCEIPSK